MNAISRIGRARRLLGWKQWAWASGLAIAASISLPIINMDLNRYWIVDRLIFHTPWLILFSYIFVVTIALVESGGGGPSFPLGRYIFAIAMAGALCIALAWVFGPIIPLPPYYVVDGRMRPYSPEMDTPLWDRFSATYVALQAAFDAMLAALIYARLRNSRLAARALADAELGRSEASRSLLAANLDAAHAEVDPGLVIERLEAIDRTYDEDPVAAEARLDELIAFLRGAIPRLRSDPVLELET